ncbi:MAG: Periplasmic sulfane dehydrogenase, diheme c-type cytochrome subunit SoxD [Nitrospira sp.]|nr:MAG: Periplasmic sulfane dehydrogenase, diheme c-type cytochrome subunit SoxD [Nitrospira sp.]
MRNILMVGLITALTAGVLWAGSATDQQERAHGYGLGRPATDQEIQAWNIDVAPTGEGLPAGQGTAKQGATIFAARCATCHGATGQEGPMDRLVGGAGTLASQQPIKTIGSYWPYATTLYDYVHRAMPFPAPQSLSSDEIYSIVAWLLYQNGIIAEDLVLNARSLPGIVMPNRQGFIPDPRPDVPQR